MPAPVIKGCTCPPRHAGYNGRRWAVSILSFIPIAGQAAIGALQPPHDCTNAFKGSAVEYSLQQTRFIQGLQKMDNKFKSIVMTLGQIFSSSTKPGEQAKGIMPTTMRVALAPGIHVAVYLSVIGVAVFLILMGVAFTM